MSGQKAKTKHRKARPIVTVLPVESLNRTYCEFKFQDYKEGKKIGEGVSGTIHELCFEQYCPYVLKIQNYTQQAMREVETQMYIYDKTKATPAIYDYWVCPIDGKQKLFIVMERMDGTLTNIIFHEQKEITHKFVKNFYNQMRKNLTKIHELGFVHLDFHIGNMFYKKLKKHYKWYIGDWGLSMQTTPENLETAPFPAIWKTRPTNAKPWQDRDNNRFADTLRDLIRLSTGQYKIVFDDEGSFDVVPM